MARSLKGVRQSETLDLFRVGRQAGIDRPAEKLRPRMLLAVPLHFAPHASTIYGPSLGDDVQIQHATERMADCLSARSYANRADEATTLTGPRSGGAVGVLTHFRAATASLRR
jgi:hypothetical protein